MIIAIMIFITNSVILNTQYDKELSLSRASSNLILSEIEPEIFLTHKGRL
jgi:hypothetical protein